MHRRPQIALRAGLVALVLATAVPAAAFAQVVHPVSVTRSLSVPAGATRSLTLSCPNGAVALNGAATSRLAARDSIPAADARSWTFRFTAADASTRGAAVLRCVGLRSPAGVRGGSLVVGTVRDPDFRVRPRSTRRFDLHCASGQLPTGWGLARRPGSAALQIAAAVPTRRGWLFRVENTSRRAALGTLRIRCLRRIQRAQTGQQHSFSTRVATFHQPGSKQSHACRRSEFSISAGLSLDPVGDAMLRGAYPAGARGGRWLFSGASDAPPETSLVCLSRVTLFR